MYHTPFIYIYIYMYIIRDIYIYIYTYIIIYILWSYYVSSGFRIIHELGIVSPYIHQDEKCGAISD